MSALPCHCSIIHNNQDLGKKTLSVHHWMNGEGKCHTYTHTHTLDYYSTIRKKDILSSTTTLMELENIMLSGINQNEKEKYFMKPLICEIWKSQTQCSGCYQGLGVGELGRYC